MTEYEEQERLVMAVAYAWLYSFIAGSAAVALWALT